MINPLELTIYSLLLLAVVHSSILSRAATANEHQIEPITSESTNSQVKEASLEEKMEAHKCGGLGPALEKDDHVTDVVNEAKGLIEEKTGLKIASISVHSYKKQVVAGLNFFVKVS